MPVRAARRDEGRPGNRRPAATSTLRAKPISVAVTCPTPVGPPTKSVVTPAVAASPATHHHRHRGGIIQVSMPATQNSP